MHLLIHMIGTWCNRFAGFVHHKYKYPTIQPNCIIGIPGDFNSIADTHLCIELTSVGAMVEGWTDHYRHTHHYVYRCNGICVQSMLEHFVRSFPYGTLHWNAYSNRTYCILYCLNLHIQFIMFICGGFLF